MNKRYAALPDSNKCSALRQHLSCTNRDWRLFKHRSCLWLRPASVSDTPPPPVPPTSQSVTVEARLPGRWAATSSTHSYPSLDDPGMCCRLVTLKPGELLDLHGSRDYRQTQVGVDWQTLNYWAGTVLHHVSCKAVDTPEDFQVLTNFKNVGGMRREDYFNHFWLYKSATHTRLKRLRDHTPMDLSLLKEVTDVRFQINLRDQTMVNTKTYKQNKNLNHSSTRHGKPSRDSQRPFKTLTWHQPKGGKDYLNMKAGDHRWDQSAVDVDNKTQVKITQKEVWGWNKRKKEEGMKH